jgi:hypothetical protein
MSRRSQAEKVWVWLGTLKWAFYFNFSLFLLWVGRLTPGQIKTWMGYAELAHKHLLMAEEKKTADAKVRN